MKYITMPNTKTIYIIIASLVAIGAISSAEFYVRKTIKNSRATSEKIAAIEKDNASLKAALDALQESQDMKLETLHKEFANTSITLKEVTNRQAVRQQSQEDLLTVAVAKVTPSVVSIVISKNVPQLEVTYQNPFGDDPFFKGINIQVPVYKQKGTKKENVGAGTGFLITQDGYILTNKHVVSDDKAEYTALLSSGKQSPAKVIYRDTDNDIAIVKIDGTGYKAVEFGDSDSIKLGQSVAAIGNALGKYNNSVSVGVISGLNRSIQASGSQGGAEQLNGVIQTDAAINPGNSGGPLLTLDGKVVGINVATVVGSNSVSFSIPANEAREIIQSVVRNN